MNIRNAIRNGKYENLFPFETRKKDPVVWEKYKDESDRVSNLFVTDVINYIRYMVPEISIKACEEIYRFAWREGHSSGYDEVINYVDEIIPIVRIVLGRKK